MGRRRHSKQGQKRQNQKTKRRGGGSLPPQPLRKAHGSDPECGGREERSDEEAEAGSPLWNSLDEQSLAGLSPPPSLSAVVAADYVYKSGLSSDEMEVTRKLSCLNFSVLPCSAPDALLFSRAEPESGQYLEDQNGGLLPVFESVRGSIQAVDMSDIEQYSELPPATQLDVLLPSVDHQLQGQGGGLGVDCRRDLEAMDCEQQRRRRKRTSRKKPNRRTKKMRLHHQTEGGTSAASKPPAGFQPIMSNFVPSITHSNEGKEGEIVAAGQLRRTRSLRRSKRQSRTAERSDPMSCILSDTSAMCELDGERGTNGGEMPNGDDFFNATPPAEEIPPMDMTMMEGLGCMGGPAVSLEELPNESDLTETTTDSGCEGDDEESSVEGPSGRGHNLPGWWDKEDSSSSDDEKFTQILTGTFPLMSKDGRSKFQRQLDNGVPDEFKNPARFGILAKGGRKKRLSKPSPSNSSLTLNEVTQKLTSFVQNEREMELQFGLVSRALCRTILCLAKVYQLECVIEQKRRLPVANPLLRKTVTTRVATRQEIEPILRNHGRESPTTLLKDSCARDHSAASASKNRALSGNNHGGQICESTVVGGKAAPLNETNVGNRMLQGMGWSPGMGLGPDGVGIKAPIVAYVRPRRVGLGY